MNKPKERTLYKAPSEDKLAAELLAKYQTRTIKCKASTQDKLIRALSIRGATYTLIETILKDEFKILISDSSISKHLRKQCGCNEE